MDQEQAARDLEFIRDTLERTHRRVDPHALHLVVWGAIVMVWYPLLDVLVKVGKAEWNGRVIVACLAAGTIFSTVYGIRTGRRPRLAGENTFVSRQVGLLSLGVIGGTFVLNFAGHAFGCLVPGNEMVLWGLAYATLAFGIGVVYSREFLWSGVAIFAGTLLAMALPGWRGVVLGPTMGLGLIVPGLIAERRVRRMVREAGGPGAG